MLWILVFAAEVDIDWCPKSCSNRGACIELYKKDPTDSTALVTNYICECRSPFTGIGCEECEPNLWGP